MSKCARDHRDSRSGRARAGGGHPRSVALICDEPLQWDLFRLLEAIAGVEAVACSSLRQMMVSFGPSLPDVVVVDAHVFGEDLAALRVVRGLLGRAPHLVVLTDGRCGDRGRLATENTSILVKPVSAVQLLESFRGRSATRYVKTFAPSRFG